MVVVVVVVVGWWLIGFCMQNYKLCHCVIRVASTRTQIFTAVPSPNGGLTG
jgi:hypothetical protein